HAQRRLAVQLWAEALRDPAILKVTRQGVAGPRRVLAELVSAAQARGELPDGLDADAVAHALIAFYHGMLLQVVWDDRIDMKRQTKLLETAINLLAGMPRRTAKVARPQKKGRR